jgi:hypothetical protein
LYAIFVDPYARISIHLAPVPRFNIDKILLFYNKNDYNVEDFLTEITESLENFSIEYETIASPVSNYVESLVSFTKLKEKIVKVSRVESTEKIIINSSTQYLPGILSLFTVCSVWKLPCEFVHLSRDASGNWRDKEQTEFLLPSISKNTFQSSHLDFLLILDEMKKKHENKFSNKNLIEYLDQIGKLDGLNEESDYMTIRKRLSDFLDPLLSQNIILKSKVKRKSVFSLNILKRGQ